METTPVYSLLRSDPRASRVWSVGRSLSLEPLMVTAHECVIQDGVLFFQNRGTPTEPPVIVYALSEWAWNSATLVGAARAPTMQRSGAISSYEHH